MFGLTINVFCLNWEGGGVDQLAVECPNLCCFCHTITLDVLYVIPCWGGGGGGGGG